MNRALLASLLAALPGCAELPVDSSQQEIINGLPATADVNVVGLINRNLGFLTCSGTLVAPRVVLTAAHCLPPYLDEAFGIDDFNDLAIYFGEVVGNGDPTIGVVTGRVNLDWDITSIPNDIGILYLESEAPVAPMPMNTDPAAMAGLLSTEVRAIGYGTTSPEGAGGGARLQGNLLLESADSTNMFSTAFPGSICPGDSGGALFGMINGSEVLVGVASRGNCSDTSIHERVGVHYDDFIAPFIADPFAAFCDEDGQCAENCAAPDPDCPCATDGFCHPGCDDLGTDADCSATCEVLDGQCGAECEFADLDCLCAEDGVCSELACLEIDPDCSEDGGCGCASGGKGGGSALILILIACALIWRRRR